MEGKWAAVPFPSFDPKLKDVTYCNCDVMVIPRGAKHPAQAFEFMAFVTQQKEMEKLALLHQRLRGLPAYVWDGTGENPYFGMLGAITLFVLCFRSELVFASLRFIVTGVGAAFSLYLTSLEATKINAYCVWCLGSATVWCLLVIIVAVDLWRLAGSSEAVEAM